MLTRKTPLFVSAVLAASIALAPGPVAATAAERGAPQPQIVADSSSAVVGEQAQPDSEAEAGRLAFVLISKLYRQMYANTGIATDSARVNRSARWARLIAKPCRRLFAARPLPHLAIP